MGIYYHKLNQFKRELIAQIDKAHKHRQAVSIAVYTHSSDGNPQPKLDREIGEFGTCFHLNFEEAHKIKDMKKLKEFDKK